MAQIYFHAFLQCSEATEVNLRHRDYLPAKAYSLLGGVGVVSPSSSKALDYSKSLYQSSFLNCREKEAEML
jgi:hypothetical protein